ncbi:hypothetical protein C6V83_15990 [Gordonia iterans]|uniref:Uncharacterized protein n=1 Tax=Gordonia iterans TaxID=1004901 RepID=A0A2S0KIK8_9ACTN|nr:hypothetical protein C6V83_15990 [Gordonia iterans]
MATAVSTPASRLPRELPDLPTLVGLRSRLVLFAIGVLAAGYVIAMVGTSGSAEGSVWAAQTFAFVLQILCLLTAIAIPADPLPTWAAAVIAIASLGGLAVAWWYMPPDSQFWVQATVPPSLTAAVAGVIAIRGRFAVAGLMAVGTLAIAAFWAVHHDHAPATALPMSSRVVGTVLPAVIIAAMVRPMMSLMGLLRERELAAVRFEAARQATADERCERLDALAREVSPILQRVADGEAFTESEALAARLLEQALRDERRGRVWNSEGVRRAATEARSRGISVQLFDDGGLDLDSLSATDAETLRGELIRTLTAAESGGVTARILPPGRHQAALINVIDGDAAHRRACVRTPAGLRWT